MVTLHRTCYKYRLHTIVNRCQGCGIWGIQKSTPLNNFPCEESPVRSLAGWGDARSEKETRAKCPRSRHTNPL